MRMLRCLDLEVVAGNRLCSHALCRAPSRPALCITAGQPSPMATAWRTGSPQPAAGLAAQSPSAGVAALPQVAQDQAIAAGQKV